MHENIGRLQKYNIQLFHKALFVTSKNMLLPLLRIILYFVKWMRSL